MPVPMHHWFLRGAASAASQPALRLGNVVRTYADVHETASRWAWGLRSSLGGFGGFGDFGDQPARIGLLTAKNETRYIGFLAALYAGATVVPVNPRWPASRITHVLDAASVTAVIVDQHHRDWTPPSRPRATPGGGPGRPPRIFGPADQEAATVGSRSYLASECAAGDIAYIIFTSGSTGEPKGVPISHENSGAFLAAMEARYDVGPGDVFGQLFEISFDLSIFEIFCAWSRGACVCPLSRFQAAIPPRCVDEWGITVWTSTPSLATMLRNGDSLPADSLSRLRYTVFCGEPLPVRTARYWMSAAPSAYLDNLYGPTEAAVACTGFQVAPGSSLSDFGDADTVPIGWPFPGVDCLIDQSGAGEGAPGELCVAGPQVFGGYLNPGFNAQRFLSSGGRRWYRTGDQVRRTREHGLVHLGRVDDQVKVNGYRIELAEVERAVERRVPGASCGAVVVSASGGLAALGAFVVGAHGHIATLRADLAGDLPPYMVPTHIWSVPRLPVNQNGKIDRSALCELSRKMLNR